MFVCFFFLLNYTIFLLKFRNSLLKTIPLPDSSVAISDDDNLIIITWPHTSILLLQLVTQLLKNVYFI